MVHIMVLRKIQSPKLLQAEVPTEGLRGQPGVAKTPSGICAEVSARDFSKGCSDKNFSRKEIVHASKHLSGDRAMKALNPEQVERILKAASQRSKRDHCMILLCFKHGLRASEICALKLADLDMKNGKLTVRRLKGSQTNEQALFNEVGNPLMSELRVLKLWLAERQTWGQDSEYCFLSQKGGAMSRVQFYRLFESIAKEAGIPEDLQHPHALKHGLGLAMGKAGAQIMVIKQALGHKSLQSTAVYTSADDTMADRARRQTFGSQF